MKYFISTVFSLISLFVLVSCKKADGGAALAPANLAIKTEISTDGSGSVVFTATADGAVSFDFEYGNGEVATVPSGTVTYKYSASGSNIYPVTVTAKGSSGLTVKKTVQITVVVNTIIPGLFWSDEFNTDGAPDPAKWGYDLGTGSGGWGNSELEYYTSRPENVIVQGGVLKIKAIKESYSGSAYTSARILSKGKFDFTYGKVEAKAKLPAGVGTWPAIWMLGSNLTTAIWPACGEIDIVEHRGSELNKIFGTLHYPGRSGGNADGSTKVITNATTEFHVYTVDWSAASIKIYVDNQLYHTVTNSGSIPFNHNFFLIMNVAMGGTFGGTVDPAFTNSTMEVDYIRVYK
jgi:beta-glucanase (GH16 family)